MDETDRARTLEELYAEDDEKIIAAVVEFVRLLAGDKRL